MWSLIAAVTLLAHAAPPELTPTTDGRVTIDAPAEWKVLVKDRPQMHNVTISGGLSTTVTLYWYPLQQGVTHDLLLDVLMETVNDTLPLGEATELSRHEVPGMDDRVNAKQLHAEVTAGIGPLAVTMKVGAVTLIDQPASRVVAAFLVAPPPTYEELDGIETLTTIVRSLRLSDDPLRPMPAWWWGAEPPELLAAPPAQP
ncbi:MAG: hypothetical protein H6732_04195 [Alphaproteobacteria bacterium]|nr:hypothetical protein [Alphaproteobacteria bacterium]